MEPIEVHIDTEEIAEFLTIKLIERGYVPTDDEVEELADIFFDYLIEKNVIDEGDIEEN